MMSYVNRHFNIHLIQYLPTYTEFNLWFLYTVVHSFQYLLCVKAYCDILPSIIQIIFGANGLTR